MPPVHGMSQNLADQNSEFVLCARLLRSLAHMIRGDLSVINNDLVYLSSIVGESELERSRARCAQVAAVVGKLRALSPEDPRSQITGAELAAIFGAALEDDVACARIAVDSGAMTHVACALREVLGGYSAVMTRQRGEGDEPESLLLELTRSAPSVSKAQHDLFSSLAAAERGERAVVDGCIIDIVFRNHGWQVDMSRESVVRVFIPCEPRGL